MVDFFQWLDRNPALIIFLVSIVSIFVLIYFIAFLQGRDISFWPPKIGSKESAANNIKKNNSEVDKNYSNVLRDRAQLVGIEKMAQGATEISAMGVTLITLIMTRADFFTDLMNSGCNLRFLIIDPESKAMEVWKQPESTPTPEDSYSALKYLDALQKTENLKGKCEVRLCKEYLPFSLVYTKTKKNEGVMNVEFLARKVSISNRPHLHLSEKENEEWFDFFTEQFENFWEKSAKREQG